MEIFHKIVSNGKMASDKNKKVIGHRSSNTMEMSAFLSDSEIYEMIFLKYLFEISSNLMIAKFKSITV